MGGLGGGGRRAHLSTHYWLDVHGGPVDVFVEFGVPLQGRRRGAAGSRGEDSARAAGDAHAERGGERAHTVRQARKEGVLGVAAEGWWGARAHGRRLTTGGGRTRRSQFAPFYRVVVIDSRARREGKPIQYLGWYNPMKKQTSLNAPAIKDWISKGAQPSESVARLLVKASIIELGEFGTFAG